MDAALAVVLGAVVTVLLALALTVPTEVDRHDRQIAERDQELEEWIVTHHRTLLQRFGEIAEQGVDRGGLIPAGHTAVRTLHLYAYREELRQAGNFVLGVDVQERWPHRLYRRVIRRPLPELTTPKRAARLVDYWEEGTARNALTWSLDDILADLPVRATSRARAEEGSST